MGLFGKLFEKKECSICGGEIGLLGNRKLEDGNLCKTCAGKLSPWFNDRRHSTVEEIAAQLEYREANMEKLADFRVTRTIGENTKVLLDEDAGEFIVTSSKNFREENPDVIAFSDVTGCLLDVDEDRTEQTRRNADGEEVSYRPPRYTYEYDFYMTINVRNPYFDEMRFKLNNFSVRIEESGNALRFGGRIDPAQDADYRKYQEMGEEIKEALMQARQQFREERVAEKAPKTALMCPFCGAKTIPDASGCCEYCGGALGQ